MHGSVRLAACLSGIVMVLTSCGGSGGATSKSDTVNSSASANGLTGPPTKIVPVPGAAGAVVALFPNGQVFYSPDGFNLNGTGSTISAYSGSLQVTDIVALGTGIEALMSDGSAYFSPDGQNLGGGGGSVRAYGGSGQIASVTRVGAGIDAVFTGSNGSNVYYSSDGKNLGGGGHTIGVYAGAAKVQQIINVGPGDAVVALFDNGTAFYSPDNRNLGGGGTTVPAGGSSAIKALVPVGGGVLAQFASRTYLSPDGQNLSGGGSTVAVPAWDASIADGPFPGRDSAHGAIFLGRLWISGGFADATNNNSCFLTCSFYDLWSSKDADGASWNLNPSFETATTPNPRDTTPVVNNGVQDSPLPSDFYDSYSPIIVWNGELMAIGATVWRSANGTKWARNNLADGSAAPGPLGTVHATENSRAVVLGSVLYFVQIDTGEVYSTTAADATGWTDLGPIPGFTPRCGGTAFVLQGQIWIEGGGACDYSHVYNDIWSSADGVHWTQQPTAAAWSGRMWSCVATGDEIVWLAGGYAPTDWLLTNGTPTPRYAENHADVWYSRNGTDWRQLKADLGSGLADDGEFEPRHAPSCYVTGASAAARSLVIMAGSGGSDPDDAHAETLSSIRRLPLPDATSLP